MAGTVDILQRCYTGLRFDNGLLAFHPCIPEGLKEMSIKVKYQGRWIDVCTTPDTMTIASDACESSPIQFRFGDEVYELYPGQKRTFRID